MQGCTNKIVGRGTCTDFLLNLPNTEALHTVTTAVGELTQTLVAIATSSYSVKPVQCMYVIEL